MVVFQGRLGVLNTVSKVAEVGVSEKIGNTVKELNVTLKRLNLYISVFLNPTVKYIRTKRKMLLCS